MVKSTASTLLSLALAATSVNAHAFFHTGFVNGVSQGHLFGVRAPQSNNPIQDPSSSAIVCNSPLNQPVSTDVIEVAPGDEFGTQWNHNIAGPTAGDADDPIAASHKGPVMVYMAKVDDASTSDGSGLKWFKVAEEGLDTSTGKWGVDSKASLPTHFPEH
jgi:cellulase